jgi:hypothetical protein
MEVAMKDENSDWQALKSDWQASGPAEEALAGMVRGSLVWRIWASRIWFSLEVLSFLFLGFLVIANIFAGQLAIATEVAVITVICLAAVVWARSGRVMGSMKSLIDMIELTLSRARKSLRLVYVTYAAVAALYVKTVIEASAPLLQDDLSLRRIAWLTFCGTATAVYHFYIQSRMRRFDALRRSIRGTGESQ